MPCYPDQRGDPQDNTIYIIYKKYPLQVPCFSSLPLLRVVS